MKKIVLSLAASLLFLCACNSLTSEKLSESEKLTIVDMARYTITKMEKNKKFATAAEADFINTNMPEVKVLYTGHRKGKMTMSWTCKNKTINFVYSGEFLTDRAMWKMGIVRHTLNKSKGKVDPLKKVKSANPADFDDLRVNMKNKAKKQR